MFLKKRKPSNRSKYVKVPIKTKIKFLRKVILEGFSIKDSATIFDINYSTAKTLIGQYKSQTFHWNLSPINEETELDLDTFHMRRCGYRMIETEGQVLGENSQGRSSSFYLQSGINESGLGSLKMVSQLLHNKIQIISSTTQQ